MRGPLHPWNLPPFSHAPSTGQPLVAEPLLLPAGQAAELPTAASLRSRCPPLLIVTLLAGVANGGPRLRGLIRRHLRQEKREAGEEGAKRPRPPWRGPLGAFGRRVSGTASSPSDTIAHQPRTLILNNDEHWGAPALDRGKGRAGRQLGRSALGGGDNRCRDGRRKKRREACDSIGYREKNERRGDGKAEERRYGRGCGGL